MTAFVSGANLHDSQVAIPLEKLTERRLVHLFAMVDAACDAPEIRDYTTGKGRIAVIDFKKRRKASCPDLGPLEREQQTP